MNKRSITSISGDSLDCEVIRFFEKDQKIYLIYSLNEIDEVGYVKLYASKVVDGKANIITDDSEWSYVKEIIKDIVRNNRDGLHVGVKDLNENKLDKIILEDTRIFKLQGNLVNLLMENKCAEEDSSTDEIDPAFDLDVEIDGVSDFKLDDEESVTEIFDDNHHLYDDELESDDNQFEYNEKLDTAFEANGYDEMDSDYNEPEENRSTEIFDYKILYNELKEQNALLEQNLADLKREIASYKEKIADIENILRSE